jgi:predicted MPP superfamily phosphohydrolase
LNVVESAFSPARTLKGVRTATNEKTATSRLRTLAVGTVALGAAATGYAAGIERRHWTLRTARIPVLSPGSRPVKVLHISDLHMMPEQHSKQRWITALDQLEPDLVINTGDNLSHQHAVPAVIRALGPLLTRPGMFIFGSNDYFAPRMKNPLHYLLPYRRATPQKNMDLPWRDLRAAFIEHGWQDLTHVRRSLMVNGQEIFAAGVNDPHIQLDRYASIQGRAESSATLRLGLTHSPEPHILDAFAADHYDLVLAGHTHGGQLRVPGFGPLVTNCELDRARARGVSRWGAHMWLNVSAGLGTSPFAPLRFACPPEASLLTLVPRESQN